jgi:hypothetical protein
MNWFWMNVPLALTFWAVWTGVPLWLVFRHPDSGPASQRTDAHPQNAAPPPIAQAPACQADRRELARSSK